MPMMPIMMMMMMMMMAAVQLGLACGVLVLPAPTNVSMESVNMRHTLRWRPLQAGCNTTLLYSVQFQGEFELVELNGSWIDAPECQLIPHARCDLTFDLGSDSNYSLRVRAQCGWRLTPWTELSPPFNRRDTVLTVPHMALSAERDGLHLTFDQLPLMASVSVTVWRRGDEQQTDVYSVPAGQAWLHVGPLLEGAEYCVRAQMVLDAHVSSVSSNTHCITTEGATVAWKRPIAATATVILMAGLVFAVSWSMVRCRPDACQTYFRKEPLPRSLQPDWEIQNLTSVQEVELICQQVHVLPGVDPGC